MRRRGYGSAHGEQGISTKRTVILSPTTTIEKSEIQEIRSPIVVALKFAISRKESHASFLMYTFEIRASSRRKMHTEQTLWGSPASPPMTSCSETAIPGPGAGAQGPRTCSFLPFSCAVHVTERAGVKVVTRDSGRARGRVQAGGTGEARGWIGSIGITYGVLEYWLACSYFRTWMHVENFHPCAMLVFELRS